MKIFISYSNLDSEIAIKLRDRFEGTGAFIIHFDKSAITVGDEWRHKIFREIERCDAFVLLWSKNATISSAVYEEIIEALNKKIRIITCKLDDSPLIPLLKEKQFFKLDNIDLQFVELLNQFDLPLTNIKTIHQPDLKSIIRTYKSVVSKSFNSLKILFENSQRTINDAYIQLSFAKGLDIYEDSRGLNTTNFFDRLKQKQARIIIAGHPGTGKTSTIQYLMYNWAISEDSNLFIHCNLSKFDPDFHSDLITYIRSQLSAIIDASIIALLDSLDIFTNYSCVLVLDGLDEIASSRFNHFTNALEVFQESYTKTRYLVTTRIDGFKGDREEMFLGWDMFTITPLDNKKKIEFIEIWFKDKDKVDELVSKISGPRLATLSKRSFLLALICLVFEEHGRLGKNRSELYRQATEYLEQSRSQSLPNKIIKSRRDLLKKMALLSIQLAIPNLSRKIILAICGDVISPEIDNEAILNSIINDSGLLQKQAEEYYFTHKSFQEYYSALALIDRNDGADLLLQHGQVQYWEETFKLYAGLIPNKINQEKFIEKLWSKNSSLALRSLSECSFLSSNFINKLLSNSPLENKISMITNLKKSLRLLDSLDSKRITIETLRPLFEVEKNSSVLYNAINVLKEFDPYDEGRILFNTFQNNSKVLLNELLNDSSFKFLFSNIEGGYFIMGDNSGVDQMEKPTRRVKVDSFRMTKYQITNLAYEYVMGEENSKREILVSESDSQPVININWFDAYIFSLKIGCCLPTEAQWEYAARAGSQTQWCFGDESETLSEYANYEDTETTGTREVGKGKPNAWGLFDIHGNVWEWCSDWLAPYSPKQINNPKGPISGTKKVRRGGGHAYHARGCRSAFRWGNDPSYSFKDIGIRIVQRDESN